MNEQLCQSIAKQAAHSLSADDLNPYNYDLYIKKIMELVVRECAEICLEANDHKNILRHFGVEE